MFSANDQSNVSWQDTGQYPTIHWSPHTTIGINRPIFFFSDCHWPTATGGRRAALHNRDDVVGIFIACFFSGMLQIFIFSSSPDPLHLPVTNDQKETVLTVLWGFFLSFFVVARLTLATRPPPLEDDSAGRDQRLDTGLLTKYLCLLVQTLNWFHIMARPQHRNEVGAPWLKSNSS